MRNILVFQMHRLPERQLDNTPMPHIYQRRRVTLPSRSSYDRTWTPPPHFYPRCHRRSSTLKTMDHLTVRKVTLKQPCFTCNHGEQKWHTFVFCKHVNQVDFKIIPIKQIKGKLSGRETMRFTALRWAEGVTPLLRSALSGTTRAHRVFCDAKS